MLSSQLGRWTFLTQAACEKQKKQVPLRPKHLLRLHSTRRQLMDEPSSRLSTVDGAVGGIRVDPSVLPTGWHAQSFVQGEGIAFTEVNCPSSRSVVFTLAAIN